MSSNLTKKQQKAQAFRAKQKAKKSGREDVIPADIPKQEPMGDEVEEGGDVDEEDVTIAEASTKKRKREQDDQEKGKGHVKGKGKAKAKTAWDEEEGDDTSAKKSKKEIKQRFIIFVGNLGYKVTREDVQQHFAEAAGARPAVRLLTTKPSKPGEPAKSRGIAFVEVPTSTAMQACLKLHHTLIQNRRINVELTAGGGGKSDSRSAKIKERNDRVGGQRERRAEREKEEETAGGGGRAASTLPPVVAVDDKPTSRAGRAYDGPTETADGVKVRGGRRVKAKPKAEGTRQHWEKPAQNGQSGQHGRRPRWEPTGANAVRVG